MQQLLCYLGKILLHKKKRLKRTFLCVAQVMVIIIHEVLMWGESAQVLKLWGGLIHRIPIP